MTSSMATGERRWASARRGGMTVLGKVAVPKPINLPSQRLENHGLDPNVEIVPKGTLSWGSRPSSAGSNAWGTSGLSPRTDGSSSSPTHLGGRPSSGGGTRPSTAGSERGYDSNVNAWGSNSRPSSASGVLASNNSSLASLRPRSAETRPGSSQLSRFAEPSADNSASRASTATSERMGIATAGNDGFSLSSGDFPTLGSEKDESGKNTEPLDCVSHGRPGSASGRVSTMANNAETADGDEISRNADFKGNSWRKDSPPYVEDGFRPGMERWHGEPHPYPNHNMARPHFESWRGPPPVNAPGGVWYRGPPGPPPYGGPPGAPGGFPMDPFPYYRPQVPPPGLTNSQPVPPGGGPHGHHSKNGDMYRPPPMPDSYMRPGMPMRPGFYPGPVPYEGYYGPPPMGFCNPNERDLPFMGMPPGPPVYNNRPVNPNGPDPNNSRPRSRERRGPDQVEPGVTDPRGNYKVLMKQNDSWDQNDEERWSHRMSTGAPNREKGILSKSSIQENAWGGDYRKDRENTWEGDHRKDRENTWEGDHKKDRDMQYGKHAPAEVPSQTREINFGSTNPADMRFPHPGRNVNETDASPVVENAASPKDHSLIQKIEGLNAKARASGGRRDDFHREHPHEKVHIVNSKANRSANEVSSNVLLEKHYPSGVVPVSRDINTATMEKSRESAVSSGMATSRPTRGVQSRGDNQGRGRFNGHEADGWIKKSESQTVSSVVSGSTTNDEVKEHHAIAQPAEVPKADAEKKSDRASVIPTSDHSDTQRAKMREIARQRAIQLQKEEEERIREQKAKALAKLEELDRRSGANQGPENPSQKSESDPSHNVLPQRQEISRKQPEPSLDANRRDGSSSVSSGNISQTNERNANDNLDSAVSYLQVGAVVMKIGDKNSISSQNQLLEADSKFSDEKGDRTAPQVREASKQKRVSHKQRQNISSEKNSMQDSTPAVRADALREKVSIGVAEEASGSLASSGARRELTESPLTSDLPVQQKKKNNKSGKNKHKAEESSTAVSLSEAMPKDSRIPQASRDGEGKNVSDFNINPSSIQSSTVAKDVVQPSEDHSSLPREDAHGRQNNTWKAQHSRKPRSSQSSNRVSEKSHGNDAVVWAPVRSHNKVEVSEQTIQKGAENSVPSETGSNMPRNSSKTKRAEMERYVPKQVAKELAQQGSIQHSSPSLIDQEGTTDGRLKIPQGSDLSDHVAKVGFTAEYKNVDGKHKQQKAQGSWRQRLSTEATPVQSSKDSSSSTPDMGNSARSSVTDQTVKSDETLVGGTPSRPDEHSEKGPQASMDDGWNIVEESSTTSSAAFSGMKAHAPSGRGKRHPVKGYKGSGYNQNFDRKDSNTALMDSQCPPLETIQAEKITSSKENRAVGDRSTSQWQPKSQGPQGSRPHGGQVSTGEDSRGSKREAGHNDDEFKPDKKGNPVKRQSNQGSRIEIESASSEPSDGLNEQRPSSGTGYRKNTNYGARFNRGHESRGDWSSTPQENKQQHYSSANRERQRQNSHFEYQPVGPHNNNNTRRSDDSGAQKDNQPQPGGQRFRERGNNYSRRGRGNFYGNQSGNPSDAGY